MAGKRKRGKGTVGVGDYRHESATRKNNPPAKIAAEGVIPQVPNAVYAYSPRLDPKLRFDDSGEADRLPELLEVAKRRKLSDDEARILAEALRSSEPWIEWAAKREQRRLEVDPVALHIHERVSTQAILKAASRADVQRDLFADPQQPYHEAVQFYQHDIDWTNRLILGDSLQVMSSLSRREDLAGKVQMIYLDPPYGIRFASNFQPLVKNRTVGERQQDLTREPEMVRAYRDTWHLGIHSYLTYLRDRLLVAKELLADSGSVFLQIGDENLHRVQLVMDEVFGRENFIVTIVVQKKGSQKGEFIQPINDYLLWYGKRKKDDAGRWNTKFRPLFDVRSSDGRGGSGYKLVELPSGEERRLTSDEVMALDEGRLDDIPGRVFAANPLTSGGERTNQSLPYELHGRTFNPGRGSCWKTTARPTGDGYSGMARLELANRLWIGRDQLRFKAYLDDNPGVQLTNLWTGLGGASNPVYVVQTNETVVERCLLLTTDPGDLVLDPTCGSGTAAVVAEHWGRRWITIDTSRVAVAIARQRILTAKYPYFRLRDDEAGVDAGLEYEVAPHLKLGAIARNVEIDSIHVSFQPSIDDAIAAVNEERSRIGESEWTEWEIPFHAREDWPEPLQVSVTHFRDIWRERLAEINRALAAHADQQELFDRPVLVPSVARVSGPFTVEAVQPPEIGLDNSTGTADGFAGAPEAVESTFGENSDADVASKNADAYLADMIRLLRTDGVRFPDNRQMAFSRLDALDGTASGLHAEGRWAVEGSDGDEEGPSTVAVAFGPQYGPVTARQVEQFIRTTNRRGYDDLVVAGFSFDGAAQAAIEESQHPNLRIHMAHIRPDVNPGMDGLLKQQPGGQLFSVFGQPRTAVDGPDGAGEYTARMEGVDVYDPVSNAVRSTGASKVAAWFLDSDYDGRTFCITQAFFPDRSAWTKLAKALKGVIDETAFDALSGTTSLPFTTGRHRSVAIKVIDPRGNEVMRVHRLEG